MINLLPEEVKQNIIYARRNTKLRRWIIVFIFSIIGVGVITVFGLFYIHQNIASYTTQNDKTRQELTAEHLEDTQKQVQNISNNLKLVVQVLSREVLFSSLIKQIAVAIPPNAVLTNLDISKTQGGLDLTASAIDYNTASQVQVNLQDPNNKIFDKADLVNISCGKTSGSRYPCIVTVRAQFAQSNPFLFINGGSSK